MPTVLAMLDDGIRGRHRGVVAVLNTESFYWGLRDDDHRRFLTEATWSVCDGVALSIAGAVWGFRVNRVHGPDLMYSALDLGRERGWSHFFYGGNDGVAQLLAERIRRQLPGVRIVGAVTPPFLPQARVAERDVLDQINEANPDFIWVGLGLPKQERWIQLNRGELDASWMIGVGAAFDFLSGTVKRAPDVYRRIGLEWLYRGAREPRMWVRNFRSLQATTRAFFGFGRARFGSPDS